MPRASSRSSASECASSSLTAAISATRGRIVADAVAEQAELQGDADEPLLRAVVQVALEPPPLVVAGGDDPLARVLQLADAILVLQRDRRRGADRAHELGILVERGVVEQRGECATVGFQDAGRRVRVRSPARRRPDRRSAARDRRACGPAPARARGRASLRTSCRRSASPPRASRERSSPARNAAGTTNSELTASHRMSSVRANCSSANSSRHDDAGDAREHGAAARPRRRAPAGEDHQRDREAGARDEPLARRVQRQRQVLVRGEQQEVSRQLVEGVHRELQDELEHERADQQALAPGLEPAAGEVRRAAA